MGEDEFFVSTFFPRWRSIKSVGKGHGEVSTIQEMSKWWNERGWEGLKKPREGGVQWKASIFPRKMGRKWGY